jgi:two-component system C4-dicarboxylate transport sensor histidine kinase DctB
MQKNDQLSLDISHANARLVTYANVKRHHVDLKFDTTREARVLCDEIEIEQVLVNLINNAIDAMKDSHNRSLSIKLFEEEKEVVLQVRDTGNGISAEHQKKLFQTFFTTKAIGAGTGLGLSIVKGILDEHFASVELLTEEKETCFEIRFNKQRSSPHAA